MNHHLSKPGRLLIIVLAALAFVPITFYLHKLPGRRAVAALCARDGGPTIYDTTFSPGYVNLVSVQQCYDCIDEIAGRRFDWVAYEVSDGDGYSPSGDGGFYLLQLSSIGDEQCKAWFAGALGDIKSLRRSHGMTEDMCIAAKYMGTMPRSFTYQQDVRQLDLGWFNPIQLREVVIMDDRNSRMLARHREYFYTASITRIMDTGAGVGNPDGKCSLSRGYFSGAEFRQTVLRDSSKYTSAQDDAS